LVHTKANLDPRRDGLGNESLGPTCHTTNKWDIPQDYDPETMSDSIVPISRAFYDSPNSTHACPINSKLIEPPAVRSSPNRMNTRGQYARKKQVTKLMEPNLSLSGAPTSSFFRNISRKKRKALSLNIIDSRTSQLKSEGVELNHERTKEVQNLSNGFVFRSLKEIPSSSSLTFEGISIAKNSEIDITQQNFSKQATLLNLHSESIHHGKHQLFNLCQCSNNAYFTSLATIKSKIEPLFQTHRWKFEVQLVHQLYYNGLIEEQVCRHIEILIHQSRGSLNANLKAAFEWFQSQILMERGQMRELARRLRLFASYVRFEIPNMYLFYLLISGTRNVAYLVFFFSI
jgi:hypothetical protein